MLTDEIPQFNRIVEDLSQKVSGMIEDLEGNKGSKAGYLTVQGVALDAFIASFLWDCEMYPLASSPGNIFETIKDEISKIQEEMVAGSQHFHDIKNKLLLMQKDQLGSLTVRDLSLVVKPDDLTFSEFLTTLLVVMPNTSQQEWLLSYEFIDEDFVVARSSQLLYQDGHESLYSVTMFSHVADKFTANAEAKGFVVRSEYNPEVLIAKKKEWELILCEK